MTCSIAIQINGISEGRNPEIYVPAQMIATCGQQQHLERKKPMLHYPHPRKGEFDHPGFLREV